jgi:HD superfamily phosphohydrolase
MLIHDAVYGSHHIHEPVLIEVLRSAALQRIQGVHVSGASFLVREQRDVSRYEHSVGVMLLIRILGGSVQEQLAGLLHDVAHTAFSHVVDFALSNRTEDFHEQHFMYVVEGSSIPAILRQHGLTIDDILPLELWSLLEQPMPDLCADRIDYTLRDLLRIGFIDDVSVQAFLAQLRNHGGKIVCRSLDAALWFIEYYARLVLELFLHPRELFANQQLAAALRLALSTGGVREEDLFLQDAELLARLQALHHPDIDYYLQYLQPALEVIEDTTGNGEKISLKARHLDPLVLLEDGRVVRCSTLDSRVDRVQATMRQKTTNGICLRVVDPICEDNI